MKPLPVHFTLRIDDQPLILELQAILALFGKLRALEFADGKWSPFVTIELAEPAGSVPIVHKIEFTDMTECEISDTLRVLPRDVADFAGFFREEIEKIEKVQTGKR